MYIWNNSKCICSTVDRKIVMGISVIIPVYNRENTIEQAILSVIAQNTCTAIQTIVSDDGSSDMTMNILNKYKQQITIVRKADISLKKGVSSTRNRGIAVAKEEYISFLDSDDFYLPNHLNRMASILNEQKDVSYVISRMLKIRESEESIEIAPWTKHSITERDIQYAPMVGGNTVHTNVIVVRKTVLEKVGVFNEKLSNAEDTDMWLRICENHRGAFSDHYGAVYRVEHSPMQLGVDIRSQRKCLEQVYNNAIWRYRNSSSKDKYMEYRLEKLHRKYSQKKESKYGHIIQDIYQLIENPIIAIEELTRKSKERRRRSEWRRVDSYTQIDQELANI